MNAFQLDPPTISLFVFPRFVAVPIGLLRCIRPPKRRRSLPILAVSSYGSLRQSLAASVHAVLETIVRAYSRRSLVWCHCPATVMASLDSLRNFEPYILRASSSGGTSKVEGAAWPWSRADTNGNGVYCQGNRFHICFASYIRDRAPLPRAPTSGLGGTRPKQMGDAATHVYLVDFCLPSRAFEYLQRSNQRRPSVLRPCAQALHQHAIVRADGVVKVAPAAKNEKAAPDHLTLQPVIVANVARSIPAGADTKHASKQLGKVKQGEPRRRLTLIAGLAPSHHNAQAPPVRWWLTPFHFSF